MFETLLGYLAISVICSVLALILAIKARPKELLAAILNFLVVLTAIISIILIISLMWIQ